MGFILPPRIPRVKVAKPDTCENCENYKFGYCEFWRENKAENYKCVHHSKHYEKTINI